jgi:methionine synthase I (cobalamin-dependent)
MSHAELDEAEKLDDGDPQEFGRLYRSLTERFPHISVLGGCCGTDHRHMQEVRSAICVTAM